EEDATKAVAERVAEPLVEGLDHEGSLRVVDVLAGDLRDLELGQGGHRFLFCGWWSIAGSTWSRARRSAARRAAWRSRCDQAAAAPLPSKNRDPPAATAGPRRSARWRYGRRPPRRSRT